MKISMPKVSAILFFVSLALFIPSRGEAQIVLRNPVLEYCTGTWCQWCPCAEDIIENTILPNIPNAIIIGYHGPANTPSDPWSTFSGNSIISALGFSSYPTGLADRTTASPIDRSTWYSYLNSRWNVWATVRIGLSKTYDEPTRTMSGTVSVTPVSQLTGMYKLNLILLESGMVYPQTGNASCFGDPQAVHHNVVRASINGYLGEDLNTSSPWANGQSISKTLNYTVPAGIDPAHSKLVAFVYKVNSPLSTGEIQQGEQWDVPGTVTSTAEQSVVPTTFAISQNYPNPFNPTTTLDYAVSNQSFVAINVYNLLGQEVRTLVSEEKAVGTYTVQWDGKDKSGGVLPSGMYLYRMSAGNFVETKKMIFMK